MKMRDERCGLPLRYKEVLVLSAYGYDYIKTAERLNISAYKVRKTIETACSKLNAENPKTAVMTAKKSKILNDKQIKEIKQKYRIKNKV